MAISKEEKERIIELYNQGYNTVEIGRFINRHDSTIGAFLKKNDIERIGKVRKCTKKDIQNMISLYSNGSTLTEIGIIYNINERTVANYLKSENVKIRATGTQSKIKNEDYFKNIDTPSKAYFLGLIISDGSIVADKRGNRSKALSICLKSEDKYILELFSKELFGGEISNVNDVSNRDESYFRVSNKKITNDLSKYGVIQNKTKTAYLPKIDESLMPHLIRGIFDGDGTVYHSIKPNTIGIRFGFYGTPLIVEQIKEYLKGKINISNSKIFNKESVSFVIFGKVKDAKNFYNLIYPNSDCYLTRKKQKFEEFFHMKDLTW